MNLTTLTSSDIKHISALLERKESLLEQVQKIDAELASFQSNTKRGSRASRFSVPFTASTFPSTPSPSIDDLGESDTVGSDGRARRGQLKEVILSLLKDAGRDGISIKEIAAKAGVKSLNVSAWMAATGKKLGTIEKTGRGVYRLKS